MPHRAAHSYNAAVAAKCKRGAIERWFVVAGTDDRMVRDEAAQWFRELAADPTDEFANEVIDGAAADSEGAFGACRRTVEALQTIPFFGAKVVWLKGVAFLADNVTGRAERTLEGLALLQSTLEGGLPPGVTFLLSAGTVDRRRAFWRAVEAGAEEVRTFDKPDPGSRGWQEQVEALVTRHAAALGLEFEHEALELFVMLAGGESQQVLNELEKLDLYLAERRRITAEDVREMVPLSQAGAVFEIGNAIQRGQVTRALLLIDRQLAQGESALGVLRASVIPTVRNLFMAAALLEDNRLPVHNYNAFTAAVERLPESDRAWLPRNKKSGAVNVYPLFLAANAAGRFPLPKLREALDACARADRDLVSSGRDPRLVLQQLLAVLAPPRPPSR